MNALAGYAEKILFPDMATPVNHNARTNTAPRWGTPRMSPLRSRQARKKGYNNAKGPK